MTVTVSKPQLNLREELSALKKKSGIKGEELLRANTVADVYTSINPVMFRNRVINGDFRIDQRYAGSLVTSVANGQYTLDRFQTINTSGAVLNVKRNLNAVTPPAGFSNYIGYTVTTAVTQTSGTCLFLQPIEGQNIVDFALGTASAAPVTISFYVYSSVTGAYGGVIKNGGSSRSCPFAYNINNANTWEYKTITLPGDTAGTWDNAINTIGMYVIMSLGNNSAMAGTPGVWSSSNYDTSNTATNRFLAVSGANFYVTGLQVERGSVATPFEFRPYPVEFTLCQRYYQRYVYDAWMRAHGPGGGNPTVWHSANDYTFSTQFTLPVPMRAGPTTSVSIGAAAYLYKRIVSATNGAFTVEQSGTASSITIDSYPGYPTAAYMNVQAAAAYPPGSQMNLSLGGNTGPITYIFSAELS